MNVAALHADPQAASSKAARAAFDRMALQVVLDRDEPGSNDADGHYGEIQAPARQRPRAIHDRGVVGNALQQVLASDTFRHSQRHRTFLRYVVEAALDGRHDALKEVVIGLEVFGRQLNGYDPDRDSIVRVEARRLRRKLAQYYADEGADSTVEIRLPTGGYLPVFAARTPGTAAATRVPCVLVLPLQMPNGDDRQRGLAIALADQVIDRLGTGGGLRVMAPIAAATLRERAAEIDVLRHDHGVDYVVDGSMTCQGSRVRCVAHLSRTTDGIRVWSGRFDLDTAAADGDLFTFQDRIADAIFAAVEIEKEGG